MVTEEIGGKKGESQGWGRGGELQPVGSYEEAWSANGGQQDKLPRTSHCLESAKSPHTGFAQAAGAAREVFGIDSKTEAEPKSLTLRLKGHMHSWKQV